MYRFMRRFPGGTLLIPMLVAAIFNTFSPDLFRSLGGMSEAIFTTAGINYIVAITCFCSGAGLNIRSIGNVLKKQGTSMLIKTLICILVGYLYINKIFWT